MTEIIPNLFVGSRQDWLLITGSAKKWSVVHACASCFPADTSGRVFQTSNKLFLNSVDSPNPNDFLVAFDFIDAALPRKIPHVRCGTVGDGVLADTNKNATAVLDKPLPRYADTLQGKNYISQNTQRVLIHCDYGQSRSTALVIAYVALRKKPLPSTFFTALSDFRHIYPQVVSPSEILRFLKREWERLGRHNFGEQSHI